MATTVPTGVARPAEPHPAGSTSDLSAPDRVDVAARPTGGLPPLPQALRGHGSVILQFVMSRALALALLTTVDNAASGDVLYYARSISAMFHGGSIQQTLQEYPLPVMAIMLPQWFLGGMTMIGFELLFVASMIGLDALFARLLWRHAGDRRSPALDFWLWFVPLTGALAYFRFDLVPGILSGVALLVAARRPATAALSTLVGALLKLWPGLTILVFLFDRGTRTRVLAWFVGVGVVGVGVCIAIGGWARLISPLHWQSARGLQIESVLAGPLMLARSLHPDGVWDARVSPYKASEIFGWGVHALLIVSTVITAAAVVWILWLFVRTARQNRPVLPATMAWVLLAIALLLTVTNKTLSPQYILWLGAPIAALLLFDPHDPVARKVARLTLAIAVMTHLIFPMFYAGLMHIWWATFPTTVLLEARNVLLLWVTWIACRESVRRTAPAVLHRSAEDTDGTGAVELRAQA